MSNNPASIKLVYNKDIRWSCVVSNVNGYRFFIFFNIKASIHTSDRNGYWEQFLGPRESKLIIDWQYPSVDDRLLPAIYFKKQPRIVATPAPKPARKLPLRKSLLVEIATGLLSLMHRK